MSFQSVKELIEITKSAGIPLYEVMIQREMEHSGKGREEILGQMASYLEVMEEAVKKGLEGKGNSRSGLSGGDAKKVQDYVEKGKTLSGDEILEAVSKAMATNEVNACMGIIVATPTAGSCGVIPGALFSVRERWQLSRDKMVHFLFTAGAFGQVIANRAFISGAAGGCQAEVGSAAAMAAAALVEMAGGSPEQSAEGAAITLKNMLGLVCDPVAGLVEVPCVKRNAMGVSLALVSADLALAGVKSRIPCDEVIDTMYRIGRTMPSTLKETALGGLAVTPTAKKWAEQIKGDGPG
ncbi:MAG TPA: L-serine ammonia-lyase, iron-sulfur-dependent, subunit alpha [Paenibacillaceae bacterium]|nr:L-serine ammonia-lyase, iron-sulfur-dependent, subunit alpha [Paenibacillaceae bacterium]